MKIVKTLKKIFPILMFLYPLLIYVGIRHYSAAATSFGLVIVLLTRLFLFKNHFLGGFGRIFELVTWLVLLNNLANLYFQSELALRIYPVLMSGGASGAFFISLWNRPPLIEQFARVYSPHLSPERVRYTHTLTIIWACWLGINALISLYTAVLTSLSIWTFYNGLLFYVISGIIFAIDLGYRRLFLRGIELRGEGHAAAE